MQIYEIFESMTEPELNTGCLLWVGSLRPTDFYGRFYLYGHTLSAHRVAYELAKGPIPDGLHVLHKCHTPECVNPDHLYAGTNLENVDDRLERVGCEPRRLRRDFVYVNPPKRAYRKSGRPRKSCAGVGRHGTNQVLTADQVREIRGSSARGCDLAEAYGVSPGTISKIRKRQLWPTLSD